MMNNRKPRTYYRIDYIDIDGRANYIDTFTARQREKAIKHTNILNKANSCLNGYSYYVLDRYAVSNDEYDIEIIEKNITNAKPIYWILKRGIELWLTITTIEENILA